MKRFKRLEKRSILRKQEEEGELNALGMLPLSSIRAITLLMTSATSSLTFSAQDVFLRPTQLSARLSKHKEQPIVWDFLFSIYLSHDICSYSNGTFFFTFSGRAISFENKCWPVLPRCYSIFLVSCITCTLTVHECDVNQRHIVRKHGAGKGGGVLVLSSFVKCYTFRITLKSGLLSASLHSLRSHCRSVEDEVI